MAGVAQVSAQAFAAEVLESDTPVFVDFFTTWCPPCRAMVPVIDEVSADLDGEVKVVKVDAEEAADASRQFQIASVPTFILFKGGEVAWRHEGTAKKEDLLAAIRGAV